MNQDIAVFLVLILGVALVTGGGLCFIDNRFPGGAGQAIASPIGGIPIFALLEILLYGSASAFFNARQLQTSARELEGETAHPEARLGADAAI
jgi:hypothetical protein